MAKLSWIMAFIIIFTLTFTTISYLSASGCSVKDVEISDYIVKGNTATVTARIYIVNEASFPAKLLSLKINVRSFKTGKYRSYNIGDIIIPARRDKIVEYSFKISKSEVEKGLRILVEWNYPVTIFYLVDIYRVKNTYTSSLKPLSKGVFIWSGWNTTYIRVGMCASYTARVYPPMNLKVTVMKEMTGFSSMTLDTKEGYRVVKGVFCPKEPSSIRTRGYYLVVEAGELRWEQPESYPPRLFVRP